jgi:hypothetical protein
MGSLREQGVGSAKSTKPQAGRSGLLLGRSLGPSEKKKFESEQNEGAQMSNELESALRYGDEFRIIGADGVGYYEIEAESPSSTNPQ